WELKMVSTKELDKEIAVMSHAYGLYMKNCASCHGDQGQGSPGSIPALIGVEKRRTEPQIASIIKNGNGRMPSFQQLLETDRQTLVDFLLQKQVKRAKVRSEHSTDDTVAKVKKDFPYVLEYSSRRWSKFDD